jgi:hypothetical protein
MRPIARYFLILGSAIALGGVSLIPEAAAADGKALQLQRKAEAQIERVKAARERADARIALSKIRSSVQTRQAQEDLIRQVELLERISELMQEQMGEATQSGNPPSAETAGQMWAAVSQINAQIAQTRVVINQLDRDVQAEENGTSAPGSCNNSGANPWSAACGNGSPPKEMSLTTSSDLAAPPPEIPLGPPPMVAPK